jgi:arabinose-5-phosphate isomerase
MLETAREVVAREALALACAAARMDESLERIVDLLSQASGEIVVTGDGILEFIARKIAATLTAAGTPAVFLPRAEALAAGAPTIQISRGALTILDRSNTPLAGQVDLVLDAHVDREADPDNALPTSSAIVAMALGDALAVALMQRGASAGAGLNPV